MPNGPSIHPSSAFSDSRFREELAGALLRHAPSGPGVERKLAKVVADAASHPGRLLRAELAFRMGLAKGLPRRSAEELACALEYFHIASLLFDDLPSMDDALERRGRICAHLLHGEGYAVLAGLALITRAYGLLGRVIAGAAPAAQIAAHACVEKCLGAEGIVNGQAHDLSFGGGAGDLSAAGVALIKTVPLIRLALVLPALLVGAGRGEIKRLDALAVYWGLFYQGIDDMLDVDSSPGRSGKTSRRDAALGRPNLVAQYGPEKMRRYLGRLFRLAAAQVARLVWGDSALVFLFAFQRELGARGFHFGGAPSGVSKRVLEGCR